MAILLCRLFGGLALLLFVKPLLLGGVLLSHLLGLGLLHLLQLLRLDLINLILLLLFGGLSAGLLRVEKLMVVQVGRRLDDLHREDQILILLAIDLHVSRALAVVHKAALDERYLNRRLVHIFLPQLREVQIVRVLLLLQFEAGAVHAGVHAGDGGAAGRVTPALAECHSAGALGAHKIVCLTHYRESKDRFLTWFRDNKFD